MSLDARRVELDCAGPPHWRGSPPFSGANAGSAHSTRRAVSVSCCCRFSLSLFSVLLSCTVFSLPVFFLHSVSHASLFILIFSPRLQTQLHTLSHVTPRLAFIPFFPSNFSLSLFSVSFFFCLFPLSLFPVSFPLSDIKRNFVPRKRFKRYERGLKTCFVRGKRFRWNITVCDVDDLVIVSMAAQRIELDCAGPPHWRGSPPFSGANAGSAHSARRACHFPLSLFHVG